MKRCSSRLVWVIVCVLSLTGLARAESGPFVGIDLGVSEPTISNYRAHVHTGATGNPYFGYMFSDNLGIQGQVHATWQTPDNDHRGIKNENEDTTLLGGTVGPRLAFPTKDVLFPGLKGMEVYLTGQGGYFTGLSGRLNHSAPGFSVGGGIDFYLTENFALSGFGRWNRVYMSARPTFLAGQSPGEQGPKDIQFATAGIGLKYDFRTAPLPPPPPPPPPPVAKAPPPPPPPVKKKIILRSVYFDFDKSAIRADAAPVLDEAVRTLNEEAGPVTVLVGGHTDSIGTEQYNQKLSERRAESVRSYLVKKGLPDSRIRATGYGELRPVASNNTKDGRAQNRRVELNVE